jgi:hypothetical protein
MDCTSVRPDTGALFLFAGLVNVIGSCFVHRWPAYNIPSTVVRLIGMSRLKGFSFVTGYFGAGIGLWILLCSTNFIVDWLSLILSFGIIHASAFLLYNNSNSTFLRVKKKINDSADPVRKRKN